jgi:large subunit ribosomal protein L15
MQLHQLKPTHKKKKKKRIGRGGKRGTYSGRGIKGQKARAGASLKPAIRVFIKRYPKLRGYKFKGKKEKSTSINVETLEKNFKKGDTVNPKALLEKKIISKIKGRLPQVKILGRGEIKKALTVEGFKLSKAAKEKIEKAGGTIK